MEWTRMPSRYLVHGFEKWSQKLRILEATHWRGCSSIRVGCNAIASSSSSAAAAAACASFTFCWWPQHVFCTSFLLYFVLPVDGRRQQQPQNNNNNMCQRLQMQFVGLVLLVHWTYVIRLSADVQAYIRGQSILRCQNTWLSQLLPWRNKATRIKINASFLQNFYRLALHLVNDETVPWERQMTVCFNMSRYRSLPFVFIRWNVKQL
jgi:hypothetical protein